MPPELQLPITLPVPLSLLPIVGNLLFSFVVGFCIALLYRATHRGFSYSQSFVFSLVLLVVIVAIAIMVVSGSLARAFALLGAFSIIRFRTPIKDTRDIVYIFWSLVTGMAIGAGYYIVAAVATPLVALFIFILTKLNFGSIRRYKHLLTLTSHGDYEKFQQNVLHDIFPRYLHTHTMINAHSLGDKGFLEYTYNVHLKSQQDINAFLEQLRAVPEVQGVRLFSAQQDVEY